MPDKIDAGASARLRHAIDTGRTRDKAPGLDPAAAPLGTDDESAGTLPPLDREAKTAASQPRFTGDCRRYIRHAAPGLSSAGPDHLAGHPARAHRHRGRGYRRRVADAIECALPADQSRADAPARQRVVIIGGGFGGLNAAQRLAKSRVEVTLIDRHNYHLFQPLLYQVATAALSPADIAAPIRAHPAPQRNATVLSAGAGHRLGGRDGHCRRAGAFRYDYLVVATGREHSYFGHDDWAPFAPGLKTIEDATRCGAASCSPSRRRRTATDAAERSGC